MEGKPQNGMQEVRADEIERQIQAYALYNGISPQNSWSAVGDPLENPSGKEYAKWDSNLYMDILPGAASQRK